jgi:hypothetical protein
MFGLNILKNLTPEQLALIGAVGITGGLAAPAAAGAAATGAATGAAATGAATAGAAAAPVGAGILGNISAEAALAGTEASLAGNVGAGITGSLPAMSESYFGAAPGMGGSTMFDQLSRYGTQAKGYLDEANKVIKPVGKALGAAKTAQGLLSPNTPQMQAPAPQFGGGGNPVFMGLLQEQQAQSQARMQEEMQRRQAQQKLLEMMGGR